MGMQAGHIGLSIHLAQRQKLVRTKQLIARYLEQSLVVIEDCDEFIYCLDTSDLQDGECPIVSWDKHVGYDSIEGADFNDFLLKRLSDAKESWEEED